MPVIDGIIQEFTQECAITRKILEVVPEEHWDWKPHEKSMGMGQLASHIAESLAWTAATLDMDVMQMDPSTYEPFLAKSRTELLEAYDKNVKEATASMQGRSDKHLFANWRMEVDGQTIFEMPRTAVLKTFIISHQIHHRGQLDVYLRMKDVPLPQIYGPTADNPGMMGGA